MGNPIIRMTLELTARHGLSDDRKQMNSASGRDLDKYQQEYAGSPFEENLAAARRESSQPG